MNLVVGISQIKEKPIKSLIKAIIGYHFSNIQENMFEVLIVVKGWSEQQ